MADDEQKLLLICPDCPGAGPNDRMRSVLERALEGVPYDTVTRAAQLQPVHGRRVLFALPLDEAGMNLEFYAMLHRIRSTPGFFRDSVAALVVDGQLELYRTYQYDAEGNYIGSEQYDGEGNLVGSETYSQ